jgi:UDP-GlcNAc:undecaprenyl-phosphate GlcNAc-1-phosphate transferase
MLRLFIESIAVAASVLLCVAARPLGERLGVMDHPNSEHKYHDRATPSVGGIAILLPLLLWLTGALASGVLADHTLVTALLLCAAGVGAVGFADDQTPTTPLSRVLLLVVFLGVAFVTAPQLIADRLNWASFDSFPIAPSIYCALMAVGTVGIVNAVNMADGQNGLVSGMFVIWSACLMLIGDETIAAVAGTIFAVGIVVFVFNLRGKLFLGNCGSHGVTFVLGLLTMAAHARGRVPIEITAVWFFVPVMDCLRLITTRLAKGRSPASGDTDHFHHRLQHKLGQHYGLFAYLTMVAATSFTATLMPRFALVAIIVLTAIYFSFASLTDSLPSRKNKDDDDLAQGRGADLPAGNVVPLGHAERGKVRL